MCSRARWSLAWTALSFSVAYHSAFLAWTDLSQHCRHRDTPLGLLLTQGMHVICIYCGYDSRWNSARRVYLPLAYYNGHRDRVEEARECPFEKEGGQGGGQGRRTPTATSHCGRDRREVAGSGSQSSKEAEESARLCMLPGEPASVAYVVRIGLWVVHRIKGIEWRSGYMRSG